MNFINEFLARKFGSKKKKKGNNRRNNNQNPRRPKPVTQTYGKTRETDNFWKVRGDTETPKKNKNKKKNQGNYSTYVHPDDIHNRDSKSKRPTTRPVLVKTKPGNKPVSMPNVREECNCQASKHFLVGNCMNCGKVVCKKEGPGPCFFCGEIVEQITGPEVAVEIVESTMIDEQLDYYDVNDSWLTEDEKAELKQKEEDEIKKREEDRFKVTIDIAGRRIITHENDSNIEEKIFNELKKDPSVLYRTNTDFSKGRIAKGNKGLKASSDSISATVSSRVQHDFFPEVSTGNEINFNRFTSIEIDALNPFIDTRGIIENHKGDPFTTQERNNLIEWIKLRDANLYVYAPKGDAFCNENWRDLPDSYEYLGDIEDKCSSNDIVISYGLSPLDFDFSNLEQEAKILSEKLLAINENSGIQSFTLFLDAISPKTVLPNVFETLADAQVVLLDIILEEIKQVNNVTINVVPTYTYCKFENDHQYEIVDYLNTINNDFDPIITLIWRGPGKTTKIKNGYLQKVKGFFKDRNIVLWDRYPVNDYESHITYLNPYESRSPQLGTVFGGLMLTPSNQLQLSKIVLYTGFEFMKRPEEYKPYRTLSLLLEKILRNKHAAIGMVNLIKMAPGSPLKAKTKIPIVDTDDNSQKWFSKHQGFIQNIYNIEFAGKIEILEYLSLSLDYIQMNQKFIQWRLNKSLRREMTSILREFEKRISPVMDLYQMQIYKKTISNLIGDDEVWKVKLNSLQDNLDKEDENILVEYLNSYRDIEREILPEYNDRDITKMRKYLNNLFAQNPSQRPKITTVVGENFEDSGLITHFQKVDIGNAEQEEIDVSVNGLRYIKNYIGPDLEIYLLNNIDNNHEWDTTLRRRTQQYGYEYNYSSRDQGSSRLTQLEPLPPFLQDIAEKLFNDKLMPWIPDQCIINEYTPGQGISRHVDHKDSFLETIVSISLLSGTSMIFRKGNKNFDLYLEPRSVVVLSNEARYDWTHEIPAHTFDKFKGKRINRKRRVSLTFRKVIE
eukprot:TRINITY_DN2756_c0_g1_i2.p1 TRINITY_DN2756_c0_g1~~TRINITY_DN2756_c0_g1_i2.p1  ORF type:complete len:1009 (+),score=238.66 TRINITY_DN2756_c0_g1_i2:571-3597(+)